MVLRQPAMADTARARGLDQMTSTGAFSPHPFCDSVNLSGDVSTSIQTQTYRI